MIKLQTPLDKKTILSLKAGDEVLLTGAIYTARDQAHQRLAALINRHAALPFDLKGQTVYYCGPTAKRLSAPVGVCGPTTAGRMDGLTAPLLGAGMVAMIGKGRRSDAVRRLIKKHKVIYFLATGGIGALLARRVIKSECVAFGDLGPEAIYKMTVKDFPLIVGIDAYGRDIFTTIAKK